MPASRTQNTTRNLVWGLINKGVSLIFPFLVRSILIYTLGIEYAGLNSLFTSILSVLSLTELGVGGALTYSMYEPAAKGDIKALSALLNFYKKCYRVIGCIILAIGLILAPFLPRLVSGEYPADINLYSLFGIYLFNSVVSYLMYAYKGAVLTAYQRNEVKSNIATILQLVQYVIQIALLLGFESYYMYVLVTPFISVATNIMTSWYVDKFYPEIKCAGKVPEQEYRDIIKRIKGILFQKIGSIVLSSVDGIVISAFLGLTALALYNNYYMIVTALFGVLTVVTNSIIPSIGNALIMKSREENFEDYKKFNFIYVWIVIWMAVSMLCLYQPFIELWIGKEYVLDEKLMYLFVLYFFIHKWHDMSFVYQEAGGIWWETRYASFFAALMNVTLNIILVQYIGLAGILLSTIISVILVYNTCYTYIVIKTLFKVRMGKFVMREVLYIIAFLVACVLSYYLCLQIEGSLWFVVLMRALTCLVVPNIILVLFFGRTREFRETVKMLKTIIKK